MIEKIKIEKRRGSFWIYNWKNPKYKNKSICTSYPLYKTICNTFNPRFRSYQSTLDLYDKKKSILKLPYGYGLENILKYLDNSYNEISYEIIDKSDEYINPFNININLKKKYKPRDEIQEKAIEFLISCKDNKDRHQLFLTLLTGGGKTFCAITASIHLKLPTIIISYNLSDQWKEKILEYTTANENDIFEIRGTESVTELLGNTKKYAFYIASISTLRNILNYYSNLNLLFEKCGIGLAIFDEAHMHYKAIMNILVNSDIKYTFFLSATPNRSNYTDNKVFENLFQNIPFHGKYTENMNNHTKIRFVKYNTYPSYRERSQCSTSRGFSSINYFKYIYASEEKTLLIIGMIKYFADQILSLHPDKKILVFIPTLDLMHEIYNFLKRYKLSYSVGEYNSNIVNQEKREKELEKNLILTTIAACSTGKDIPNLKAIFSLTPFSSQVITRQLLGRLRKLDGSDTFFYDFTDEGFAPCINQCNMRTNILKQISNTMNTKRIDPSEMILYLNKQD